MEESRIIANRYKLIKRIGGGGMAIIYKASDMLIGRLVAVKLMRSEFGNDEEFLKRFKKEAHYAATLIHQNVIQIYDIGVQKGMNYIIMEYVDGISIREILTQKQKISFNKIVNFAIQICLAINEAHKFKIIHRDIKPDNILVTSNNVIKITDFGIAKNDKATALTKAGSVLGSAYYLSPEQAKGNRADERSDLYSLGITLYEMVTGDVPFKGVDIFQVALKHIKEKPVSPIELSKEIPYSLNVLILKLITKDPQKRYQSANDILYDLYNIRKEIDPNSKIPKEYTLRKFEQIDNRNKSYKNNENNNSREHLEKHKKFNSYADHNYKYNDDDSNDFEVGKNLKMPRPVIYVLIAIVILMLLKIFRII